MVMSGAITYLPQQSQKFHIISILVKDLEICTYIGKFRNRCVIIIKINIINIPMKLINEGTLSNDFEYQQDRDISQSMPELCEVSEMNFQTEKLLPSKRCKTK